MSSDGLLSHDAGDVVERVAYLEKKVNQQEDELVCLKAAMADVIRRLATVESSEFCTYVLYSFYAYKIVTSFNLFFFCFCYKL